MLCFITKRKWFCLCCNIVNVLNASLKSEPRQSMGYVYVDFYMPSPHLNQNWHVPCIVSEFLRSDSISKQLCLHHCSNPLKTLSKQERTRKLDLRRKSNPKLHSNQHTLLTSKTHFLVPAGGPYLLSALNIVRNKRTSEIEFTNFHSGYHKWIHAGIEEALIWTYHHLGHKCHRFLLTR